MPDDADIPYARQLLALARKGASGVVQLSYEGASRRIYLRDGRVAFAATTVETERIGRLLARTGDVDDKVVQEALKASKEQGVLIGQWLVDNKKIGRQKLQWGLRQQCERLTCASFAWPAAEISFEKTHDKPRGFQNFALRVPNLVLEGARRFMPPALAIDVINGIGERAVLSEDFDDVLREIRIGPDEERVIGLLDGNRTPEEIARLTLLEADDVYRIVAGFTLLGAIHVPGRTRSAWDRKTDDIDPEVWNQDTDPNRLRPGVAAASSHAPATRDPLTGLPAPSADDATPLAIPSGAAVAQDALPEPATVLTLDKEKATEDWMSQLDTATESVLLWFDGQRSLGEVLDTLDHDDDAVQLVARLVRDGYLRATSNGSAVSIGAQVNVRTAAEEMARLQALVPEEEIEVTVDEPKPAGSGQASVGDNAEEGRQLATALLQQAERLVAAGARACEAGNYAHAARFFQRALRKSPDHPDALLGLGTSRLGMNDRSGARIAWESFLRIEPRGNVSKKIRNVLANL